MASRMSVREETGLLGHRRCALYGGGRTQAATTLSHLWKSYNAQDPHENGEREFRDYMNPKAQQCVAGYPPQGVGSPER